MRRRKRRILAAGMVVVITCSSYGSVPRVYANTNFYQIREIESLSEQVLYQKVPYGTRYQDLEMPDSIDVFVSGGQTEDVPDAGSDENVAAFANRTNDDAVLEKTDGEENGEKEDTEGKDTEGKDAGENSKDKSEGGEGLEKAESGSGEQGDSGKDGNSAENGDSQDENANPGNGESDEKDDSGKTDSGSSGGNADLNEDGSSSNGKTDQPKEDVKTDEKTEEEIDEKEGFWRKVKVRWVLDAEESQASRYDGENPGIYLFRAELKSSNYEVDEDELPVIQITVLEEEQVKTTLEFAPLEESIADQILTLGSKESDIQFPETLTVRETMGEETTERTLSGITWKLDAENSDYSEFQGGLAPEDYFDRFDEDGEPEETEEKTWEGYDKANEEYNGAIYTYIPVIPESEEIPEDTALPEIHVQVGDAGIALYSGRIEGQGTEENPWQIKNEEDWVTITTNPRYCNSGNLQGCIRLEGKIDFSQIKEESRKIQLNLNDKTFDGNGYPIENLTKPLFSVANGTVKNLILPDVEIDGNENQGAIAQTVGGKATIENCYISGSITATGNNNGAAGGLIGAAQNDQGAPLTIENCVVNANITGKGKFLAGGLIGSVSWSNAVTIKKCIAMGSVSNEKGQGAGGLVGGPNRRVTIKNSAALQEEVSTKGSKYYVDRIFGYDYDDVYVNGEQNFAYQDMRVKCGEILLDKDNDKNYKDWPKSHRGERVSKTELLTTDFWKNKIGWGSDTENWEFVDKQLPMLKMKRGNDEVEIFSGTDIPDYLQATNSLSGSVKSGENGIADAEITFKKGSSEKKVATEPDGTFSIDLADGTYTVTIKKTGYLTWTDSVTIPGNLDFILEANPVSMPSGQTVTGTFQTTDADTVTADGEIKLKYAGTENLQLNDFTLSSEEDGTSYDGVTLLEVNTGNGTGSIKIQFAKSLALGSTNEIQLYVRYKGSSIGSIVLKKGINLVQLAKPADVSWDETVKGKAVWSPVENASGYQVQLYKDNLALGAAVTLGADAASHDFTSQIAESGTYTFGVQAMGDGSTYGNSEEAKSGSYEFSEQTLENVKTAAQAALQAMTVTNMTTAEEILQAVNDVITNKKIQAEWSNEEKFNLTPATDDKDPGQNGSITGTIVLSYTAESASTETKTIEINLSIAAKYAITFASDRQDSQGEAPTLENAAARTVITLPENTFKVYGMNFGGWSDGTKTYASGASYTMPEGNVTFKAVWVQDQWDGQAVVEPAKDENGYYQISTGAELAYFRDTKISNWKAKLMCDIDMGGHDFASIPKAGAEFDGCGHTIRGLNVVGNMVPTGLFQEISSNCEIKNLTIENAVVKASNNDARVGILVGDVYDSLTVENCYVSGTIETTDGTNKIEAAGGLIGNVREKYSVEIQSCYADAEIKGTASKRFVGGLVGWTGGTTTIENSYAVVDMDVDKGDYIGGLVGCGSDSKVTISHSYAAGEALTKNPTGAAVAGISSNGSISSCVSIFPEMRSLNRIGGKTGTYQGNYGFAGTVARKSDGTILTPDPNMMGADKLYGSDATEADLKNPEFYKSLGWNFDSTWTMDSTGGYAFPILKNQTLRPNLTLDLTPSVTGITLDKTSETIYPGGSVQLTATVDVANGASREVTWKSSDPAVKVEDGLVTAADVANGTYTITATSKADPSKWAECQLTVDTAEHTVTVGRDVTNKNSPNAVVKAYASLNGAINGTNPISTIGGETGTFTFSQKAGETVYLAFTGLDPKDVVSEVTITGENNSKVNATICNLENPTVYCFTMPCSDASVQVSYAENMNAYQYTWFVGQEWGTWGTTAAFETKEWSGGDHIGSLKVTKIINGKLFREFKIKSMSLYKKDSVIPKKVNSQSELTENGNYCIEKDNTTGLPTLYVYLEGPGMVAVDIEVQDNPNAEFSITKKPGSSSYYMLNRATAKVGDLVTATLTNEGVRRMKEMQNKNACLTYSGGLLVVIYPPKFTESDGKWTASFQMPAQNIETNVYFGDKDKVTLNGTNKEVDYDGTPKSVGDEIRATISGQDLSEQFQGQYEVHYEGVNGTVYSSMTPPTNAGTYSCKIKIPDSNVYYRSDPITVQLTIKKIATKTPKAAQAAAWTDTSVTLEAPSAFVDGTAIPAGYELEYCVDQGEWQDSPVFTGLTPETTYNFYVRLKEGVNTTVSAASEAVTVQTKKASSDPSNPTKPNPSNPNPSTPNPSTPGNPQGTTTSGRDRNTSTWVKESTGWRYRLSNGTYLSGSLVLDPATGRQVEQIVWKQLRGAWWAFGADGYIRTGWVYDYSAGKWYYVDENTGMRTGWYLDPQDGRWYYLDPATGEMLTEWQLIPDLGYVYLNPYAPQPTWSYDEALKTWVYMEGAGRPYGSLYMAEWTPDGYYVNADGVWEPAR